MSRCTKDLTLLEDCHLTDPWQTTFTATVSQDSISGTYRGQWYVWDDIVDGHRVNCRRDSSQDPDNSFELTRAKCDPELIRKYQQEEEQAALLFEEVRLRLEALHDRNAEYVKEQKHHMIVLGSAKAGILGALKKFGGKVGHVLIGAAETIAPVYTVYWLTSDVQPEMQEEILMLNEAETLIGDASAKAKQALEDFKRDLAQQPECRDEFEKAKAEEAFHDQVKAKMDEWELPGGYLYLDPSDPTGVPLDAAAAFKRAASLLKGKPPRVTSSSSAPQKKRMVKVSRKNAKAAVVQLTKGMAGLKRLGPWFKKRTTADAAVGAQLQQIVQHLQEQAVG